MGQDIFPGVLRYLPGLGNAGRFIGGQKGAEGTVERVRKEGLGEFPGGQQSVGCGKKRFIGSFFVMKLDVGPAAYITEKISPVLQKRGGTGGVPEKGGVKGGFLFPRATSQVAMHAMN